MFSYTDDAIVTSSPTGRHLSTVIRALPGVPTDLWRKHADQVCQVLNELDRASKCKEMRLALSYAEGPAGLQAYGCSEILAELRSSGPYMADLERRFGVPPAATEVTLASTRIAELEKQLDDATTKLAAAQMLLEKPIEVTAALGASLYYMSKGSTATCNNRTFKRVE